LNLDQRSIVERKRESQYRTRDYHMLASSSSSSSEAKGDKR
jgi:hypothetical protein